MSMMRGPSPVLMIASTIAHPVGIYGDFAISRFASVSDAQISRKWVKMPPMTGRCMHTAVSMPVSNM